MRNSWITLVTALLIVTNSASAQAPPVTLAAATTAKTLGVGQEARSLNSLLLPLTLQASTDGKATAKFGFGAAWAVSDYFDLAATINASVGTDKGIFRFETQSGDNLGTVDQSAAWDLGASVSLARLDLKQRLEPNDPIPVSVHRRMFDACSLRCSVTPDDPFCKSRPGELKWRLSRWIDKTAPTLLVDEFCAEQQKSVTTSDTGAESLRASARKKALQACVDLCPDAPSNPFCRNPDVARELGYLYTQYDGTNTCDEGKAILGEWIDQRGRSLHPRHIVNVGFSVGRQKFDYRAAADETSSVLLKNTDYNANWKVGVAYLYLPQAGAVYRTYEGQVLLGESWEAATKTVKSCASAGDVPRQEPKAGEPVGQTDPGQTCRDATLGAPTKTSAVTLAFRLGFADGVRSAWRVAIGPEMTVPWGRKNLTLPDFALRLPIYGALSPFKEVEYKGIIRLMPSVASSTNDDGQREFKATVELAFLGQRRLFSDRFDQL